MVELHLQGAAVGADGQRLVEPAVLHTQVVEHAQSFAGEPAELVVVPFRLQLTDHDQG